MTTVLAILVIVAIVGQAALIVWLRWRSSPDLTKVKTARLLEDAAENQLVAFHTHTAKLDRHEKGPL